MAMKLLILFAAGGLGTVARYGLAGAVHRIVGQSFPWGTFAVNCLGSFLFGIVWIAATERDLLHADVRLYLLVGFMGAFTTFSTFLFESGQLLEDSQLLLFAGNIVGQVVVGLACLLLGFAVGRLL